MASLGFDATQVKPDEGQMGPIPKGWYNAMIEKSEVAPTKDGSGTILKLTFKVLDGQYRDRKVFVNLNIRNANATAQNIALGQLSAICHAVGVLRADQSEQLHNLPMKIRVKVRVQEGYEDSNDITAYKNINEVVEETGSVAGLAPLSPVTVNVGFPPAPAAQMPTINQAPVMPAMPGVFPTAAPAMPALNPAMPTAAPAFPPVAAPVPEILGNAPPQAWAAPVAPAVQAPATVAAPIPSGPVMLPAANGIAYEEYIKAGWSDQQLIDNGYMQAPVHAGERIMPAAPQAQPAPVAEVQAPASEFDPNSPPPWMQQAAAQ